MAKPLSTDLVGSGPSARDESSALWDVVPLGLLLGGLAAVTRAYFWTRHASEGSSELGLGKAAIDNRVVAMAERWPELLAEALIASVVSALVLSFAARAQRSALSTLVALTVTFVAIAAFVTAFPDPRPGLSAATLGAAAGITLLGYGLSVLPFRGPFALVLGVLLGFGLPLGTSQYVLRTQVGMPVRIVELDLVTLEQLEDPTNFLRLVSSRPGAGPTRGVITPWIDQQTDTGDKPSLVLPPPAAVEFVVPLGSDGARLQAAAGADELCVKLLPEGTDVLPVEYRILVDDEVRWSEVVEHRPMAAGVWDATPMRWRHVESGGERRIPHLAGQTERFETSHVEDLLPAGFGASAFEPEHLRVGFGGAAIERTRLRPRAIATQSAPNIVFIVIDTLRRDRLGCYGYGKDTTPNIDRFAKGGLLFEDAYTTSSWTWPSTASLMTGLLPDGHGVRSSEACTLAQGLETLAEALQFRGYTTAAFVGNPIVEPNRYFDQGFETFDVRVPDFRMSDEFVPNALAWLDEQAPLRFFLYLHLVDPHTPHRPHPAESARLGLGAPPADWPERGLDGVLLKDQPSAEVKQYANDIYDASVATADRWVGEVLNQLEELGLSESTIVCVTSDHGEELFDRGLHGHGHSLNAELVRAPLVLRGPGIPVGRRRGVVSNRHVPTTLAAFAGTALRSKSPMIHLVDDAPPDEAVVETQKGRRNGTPYHPMYGIRRANETTIWWPSEKPLKDIPASDMMHFDDLADPEQAHDLVRVAEDRARENVARIRTIAEGAKIDLPAAVMGAGAQGRDTLAAIGYSGDARDVQPAPPAEPDR